MVFSAIPFYLIGLVLVYVFAYQLGWFPLGGGVGIRTDFVWSASLVLEILYHSILPALSILLATLGTWALSMRGMMVTVQGEDYMTFAEALGLTNRRRFLQYGLRNAILPQVTLLALSLGHVLSGSILVELVFGYPGVGQQLFRAIQHLDYFVIYGIVFILICTISFAMLVMDLVYPLLDPRIRHRKHGMTEVGPTIRPQAISAAVRTPFGAVRFAEVGPLCQAQPLDRHRPRPHRAAAGLRYRRHASSSAGTTPFRSRGRRRALRRWTIPSAPTRRAATCSPSWSTARR